MDLGALRNMLVIKILYPLKLILQMICCPRLYTIFLIVRHSYCYDCIIILIILNNGHLNLQGIIQPDMWGVTPSEQWDWDGLRKMIVDNGIRNSLLVAPMPTVSTSQILGNNECFEPYTSNLYSRRVLRSIVLSFHICYFLRSSSLFS